jgi:hypothetical protein
MRRWLKYVLAGLGALVALTVALFMYSAERDQEEFRAAKNQCERDCIQDSGSIATCRPYCASHPDTYGPNVPVPRPAPSSR